MGTAINAGRKSYSLIAQIIQKKAGYKRLMLVVFDIDGVLANCEHRLHYLKEKDYDKFYSEEEMLKDCAIDSGVWLLKNLYNEQHTAVVFLTGRPYRTEKWTREWLDKSASFENAKYATTLMRKDHDYRPSDVVKVETFKKYLKEQPYRGEILFIDDDPKNIKAMEKAFPCVKGLLFGTERLVENS